MVKLVNAYLADIVINNNDESFDDHGGMFARFPERRIRKKYYFKNYPKDYPDYTKDSCKKVVVFEKRILFWKLYYSDKKCINRIYLH